MMPTISADNAYAAALVAARREGALALIERVQKSPGITWWLDGKPTSDAVPALFPWPTVTVLGPAEPRRVFVVEGGPIDGEYVHWHGSGLDRRMAVSARGRDSLRYVTPDSPPEYRAAAAKLLLAEPTKTVFEVQWRNGSAVLVQKTRECGCVSTQVCDWCQHPPMELTIPKGSAPDGGFRGL